MDDKTCIGGENVLKLKLGVAGPDKCSMIIIFYFNLTYILYFCVTMPSSVKTTLYHTINNTVHHYRQGNKRAESVK